MTRNGRAGSSPARGTAMKKLAILIVFFLTLVSCGNNTGRFRIEGRLRGINQGELYIYSPDGGMQDLDTIKVADGRFVYVAYVEKPATFVLVFPNFSEQPVFANPGGSVEIEGNASRLREMEITGTKENDRMTEFRQTISEMTPPEIRQAVIHFVKDNPQALGSIYLVNKHFIQTADPDYDTASKLVSELLQKQQDNERLALLDGQLKTFSHVVKGKTLPAFTAKDLQGKVVSNSSLKGKVNVISVWSTWSFESHSIQRALKQLKKRYREQLNILSFCVDGGTKDCLRTIERDSIQWSTVCDGMMWETPALQKLGLSTVPGNIVTNEKGEIVATNLNIEELKKKIESILK